MCAGNEDEVQRTKLESEYKKKLKAMQKKFDSIKHNETVTSQFSTYQKKHERHLKDLEGQIARMKNLKCELDRQLKQETDEKSKYEQELRKNELKIKELELKTNQQQKILKRKNEEVVAAHRKLRSGVNQ